VSVGLGLVEELCTKGTFQRRQSLYPQLFKAGTEENKFIWTALITENAINGSYNAMNNA
jgi:hypothetical protein